MVRDPPRGMTRGGVKRRRAANNGGDASSARPRPRPQPSAAETPVGRDVLGHVYPAVDTLRAHVLTVLPAASRLRRNKVASLGRNAGGEAESRLARFLDTTLVCALAPPESPAAGGGGDDAYQLYLCFSQRSDQLAATMGDGPAAASAVQAEVGPVPPRCAVGDELTAGRQMVDFVIWLLFQRLPARSLRPDHLLCEGFRRQAGRHDAAHSTIPGIRSHDPNPHVDALKAPPWTHLLALLGRSGQEVMLHLLLGCAIFVAVDAGLGNYHQLSGASPQSPGRLRPRAPQRRSLVPPSLTTRRPALVRAGTVQARVGAKQRPPGQGESPVRCDSCPESHLVCQGSNHGAWPRPRWVQAHPYVPAWGGGGRRATARATDGPQTS